MKSKRLNMIALIIVFLGFALVGSQFLSQVRARAGWQQKVDPWVLEESGDQAEVEFILLLQEQADLSGVDLLTDKVEKGTYVYEQLTAVAKATQPPVLKVLQAAGAEYRPFWVTNGIWVQGDAGLLEELARRGDVAQIHANPHVQLDVLGPLGSGNSPAGVKCSYDSPFPCDDHGHGTHTMGTMVGDDGAENQIGMAPEAEWIACRNMKNGVGTPATYTECYEWFIAPFPLGGDPMVDGDPAKAPHVINNSWSCPVSEGCTDPDILKSVVENVRAAGILTVHSAGNDGPACSSVHEAATIYDASFTVAATTGDDFIASFSGRGPVTKGDNNPAKPDISAPGVGVRSSTRGAYGYMSGTSMAAPHVAGLAALLMAAQPELIGDVDALEQVIEESAVPLYTNEGCGGDGPDSMPNHVYGWGRIDAKNAFDALDLPLKSPDSEVETATIEWNIDLVRAPEVWNAGVTGQGIVIGGQDTGYDWQHPALIDQYRGWNGTEANHNFNWHDAIHTAEKMLYMPVLIDG